MCYVVRILWSLAVKVQEHPYIPFAQEVPTLDVTSNACFDEMFGGQCFNLIQTPTGLPELPEINALCRRALIPTLRLCSRCLLSTFGSDEIHREAQSRRRLDPSSQQREPAVVVASAVVQAVGMVADNLEGDVHKHWRVAVFGFLDRLGPFCLRMSCQVAHKSPD